MPYQVEDKYRLQYFTGTQASIWLGESWITECFGIHFQATQNIIPIFGYASSTFDAVSRGRVIVQGSFEINFVDEGYLYYMLHKSNANKIREPGEFNESQYLLTGERQAYSEIVQRLFKFQETANGIGTDEERSQVAVDALKALTSLDRQDANKVIQELDFQREIGKRSGLRNDKRNIIYDIVPFNLQGIFGNPEYTQEVTEKRILNCFLVSNEMMVAVEDEPLKERYTFIGQEHK